MELNGFFLLVAAHFLGDFAFQSEWMSKGKATSWEINGYHALTYTATLYIVASLAGLELTAWFFVGILGSHFLIDPLKARYRLIKNIWFDQVLHIVTIYLLYILL